MFKDIVFMNGVTQDFQRSIENFISEWESQSPIIEVQTSGTTGIPKTIQFNKEQAIQSAKKTGEFFQFKMGDSLLLNLSPNYIAGKLMIIRAMVHNLKLIVAPLQSNPLLNIDSLPNKIKLAAFVPSQIIEILSHEKSTANYNQIENILVGGAQVSQELEKKICKFKPKAYASFGMTETLTHFALRKIDGKTNYYTVLNGVAIELDNRSCLKVKSIGINDDFIQTNDLVELVDAENFIWLGRYDNVINSGGIKIYPEKIEALIQPYLNEYLFYITSRKNDKLGEEVVLVVESSQQSEQEKKRLLQDLKNILPPYQNPKDIYVERKIETTISGKIKRSKF